MKSNPKGPLADSIDLYLAHKRSLGKQLAKVGPMLHLLDGSLIARGVAELRQITPTHIDEFVTYRPRHSPRSYNGLIGALRGLFDWMVVHEVLPVCRWDAELAASRKPAGRSCSTRTRRVACWKPRRNCPATRAHWVAAKPTG